MKSNWGKRVLVLLAIVSLVGAGVYGRLPRDEDVEQYLPEALPEATAFELLSFETTTNSYLFSASGSNGSQAGYITVTEGPGYAGPLTVLMGWSPEGTILSTSVPSHQEDQGWFDKLYSKEFFDQYIGQQFKAPLILGDDIDVATGATISSNAVAVGVHQGRKLVAQELGESYPVPEESISFGLPEILLIVGIASVITLRTIPPLRRLKWPRYVTLAFGFGVLGIWLVRPLSLTNFSTWLIGNPPHLATNLFLYIMVFGLLGLAVVLGKNFYCYWICPFAAVQEVAHGIGRGRIKPTRRWYMILGNLRYVFLWFTLLLVLLLTNSSLSVFEPWNTLFSQSGTPIQWVLLVVVLAFSAFVYSIWCRYMCPVGAVMDLVLRVRREARKLWYRITRQIPGIPQRLSETS